MLSIRKAARLEGDKFLIVDDYDIYTLDTEKGVILDKKKHSHIQLDVAEKNFEINREHMIVWESQGRRFELFQLNSKEDLNLEYKGEIGTGIDLETEAFIPDIKDLRTLRTMKDGSLLVSYPTESKDNRAWVQERYIYLNLLKIDPVGGSIINQKAITLFTKRDHKKTLKIFKTEEEQILIVFSTGKNLMGRIFDNQLNEVKEAKNLKHLIQSPAVDRISDIFYLKNRLFMLITEADFDQILTPIEIKKSSLFPEYDFYPFEELTLELKNLEVIKQEQPGAEYLLVGCSEHDDSYDSEDYDYTAYEGFRLYNRDLEVILEIEFNVHWMQQILLSFKSTICLVTESTILVGDPSSNPNLLLLDFEKMRAWWLPNRDKKFI